jgi:hypothetical protein
MGLLRFFLFVRSLETERQLVKDTLGSELKRMEEESTVYVCVCVRACVCVCVCVYIYICTCMYICIHTYMYTYTYTYIRVHTHICVYIFTGATARAPGLHHRNCARTQGRSLLLISRSLLPLHWGSFDTGAHLRHSRTSAVLSCNRKPTCGSAKRLGSVYVYMYYICNM